MDQELNKKWYSIDSKSRSMKAAFLSNELLTTQTKNEFDTSKEVIEQVDEFIDNAKVYTSISNITTEDGHLIIAFANGLTFDCGKVRGDKFIPVKTTSGIEYRYESEPEDQLRLLVPIDDILFKFENLTDEQRDLLAFHFSDFTEDEIKQLQEPALEAAQLANDATTEAIAATNVSIQTNEKVKVAEEARVAAENIRNSNEATRISSEQNRITEETIRIQAEKQRNTDEDVRKGNEAIRVNSEELRDKAEIERGKAETIRSNSEKERISNESIRDTNEINRQTEESARSEAESIRIINENQRIEAEKGRKEAETNREDAEKERKLNEEVRESSEADRIDLESVRKCNEDIRLDNESKRVTAENTRLESEKKRITEEETRVNNEVERQESESDRVLSEDIRNNQENDRITSETNRVDSETERIKNEANRVEAESSRIEKEKERDDAEKNRIASETERITSETERSNSEKSRSDAESLRDSTETKRIDAESDRNQAELLRVQEEQNRISEESKRNEAELVRKTSETDRIEEESKRSSSETDRINAEKLRNDAEDTRVIEEKKRDDAEKIRIEAEISRIKAEEQRVIDNNEALVNAAIATESANNSAAAAQEMADKQPIFDPYGYVYFWDRTLKDYVKSDVNLMGKPFSIAETYPSVEAMKADADNEKIPLGSFVAVSIPIPNVPEGSDTEEPDTAKLYVKNERDGVISFNFIVDMSGARGFTGKTPQFNIGLVTKDENPSASLSPNGTDSNGNPKFLLNLVLPKGDKGNTPLFEIGTVTTGNPGDPADASLVLGEQTETGVPKYRLDLVLPQSSGSVSVQKENLKANKTYLFKPSTDGSADGEFVEYVVPIQIQTDWNATETELPSFIRNKPSAFKPSEHSHKKSEITDFPTSMPASDVSAWAKAVTKPSYTAAEVGASPSNHNHDGVYQAKGNYASSSHTHEGIYEPVFAKKSAFNKDFGTTSGTVCQGNDSRLSNSRPASDVSAWAKAATKPAYTAAEVGASPSNHNHSGVYQPVGSYAASNHNHSGVYEPVFTKNNAFNKNFGTAAGTVCQGNDSRLSNARPASDVSAWAKAGTKPTYTASEVGALASGGTASAANKTTGTLTINGTAFNGSSNVSITTPNTTYGLVTQSANGLMSAADKKKLDRIGMKTTATTVASLNVNYETIHVTLSGNASLSANLTGTAYDTWETHVFVQASGGNRTVTIPTSGSYISMCGSSVTIPSGKWCEFSLKCIGGIWHIAKMEQE